MSVRRAAPAPGISSAMVALAWMVLHGEHSDDRWAAAHHLAELVLAAGDPSR